MKTIEDKIKDGKTIATFMDFPTLSLAGRITDELALTLFKDWNSLMTVVEKIESLGYFVMINKWSSVYMGPESQRKSISSNFGDSKIDNTYQAVCQFIKWYNENK